MAVACANCRSQNADGARFCNSCGSPLSDAGPTTRKVVTVLFCDLVGSTALGDGVDPEVLRGQMSRYHARVKEVLERHGATVEKFIGDAAMAVFGLPTAHEDDALRAVRAASEVLEATAALGFEVRIGINTGEVVAGEGETLVTGDAVNVAARLEQVAPSGQILIGDLTERLVRDAVQTPALEPLAVKGKAAPQVGFRLLEVSAGAAAFTRRVDVPFVGRTTELEALQAILATAADAREAQLATVIGPPGIGKSRLVGELIAQSSARVLVGRCLSYGQGITYWPLREIADQIGDVRAALADSDEGELAAARVEAALGDASGTSDEIAWGVRKLLEAVARDRPLIVLIDDIHWAEPILLDLIEYVTDFVHDAQLMLVCTARPELLETRPEWAAPRSNGIVVVLDPLPEAHVQTLMDELADVSEVDRQRIIDAAEGNPLFIEQLVALRAEAGDKRDTLEVPPTMQALLAARIDRLEPQERAVIERASVEGRLFHRGSVQQLVPLPVQPEVGRRLLSLVRRQLVHPDRAELPGDDGFRFDHVLIRDAAYESLPKALRAELHERFATWLQGQLGERAPDEILGYHLEQAYRYRVELGLPLGDIGDLAANRFAKAARTAAGRGDVNARVNMLERAAALIAADSDEALTILLGLGSALAERGDTATALETLRDAESRAQKAGDAHTQWLARLTRIPIETMLEPEGAAQTYADEAAAALAAVPNDDAVAAQAWRLIAQADSFLGRLHDEFGSLQKAIEHARSAGDDLLAMQLITMSGGPIAYGPIAVTDCFRWIEEATSEPGFRAALEPFSRHLSGHLRARLGEFEGAIDAITSWRGHLRELGQEDTYQVTASCMWDVYSLARNWQAGESALREVEEILANQGERGFRSTIAAQLAEALFQQGRLDESYAYSQLSEEIGASDDVLTQGLWRAARAKVLAARGQIDEALTLARAAVTVFETTDFLDAHAQALVDLASILELDGQRSEADEALETAVDLFTRRGNLVGLARAHARRADA
jgi:class 3 adenylate cyclase/tetratricopeptide (TPR) repeat protein